MNTSDYSKELSQAVAFAASQFKDKYDKGGNPYIFHCIAVAEKAGYPLPNESAYGINYRKTLGILHDCVEDSENPVATRDVIFRIFGFSMLADVNAITREVDQTYEAYVDFLLQHGSQDAIIVKMADIEHNSDIRRMKGVRQKDFDRIVKYQNTYAKLKERLTHFT